MYHRIDAEICMRALSTLPTACGALERSGRCPIIGSPLQKSIPGRQFTGKDPPRPGGSGGDPIMRRHFYGAGDISITGHMILSPMQGGFFYGETF